MRSLLQLTAQSRPAAIAAIAVLVAAWLSLTGFDHIHAHIGQDHGFVHDHFHAGHHEHDGHHGDGERHDDEDADRQRHSTVVSSGHGAPLRPAPIAVQAAAAADVQYPSLAADALPDKETHPSRQPRAPPA